jgi:hypothetical protein
MMTRRGVLGVLACGAALLSGCGLIWPSDRLRQKITVEVETPDGLRTGSAVVETEVREGKSWGDASGTSFHLKGEAVAIDLPGGQTLFALLRGADSAQSDSAGYQTRLLYEALRAVGPSGPAGDVSQMDVMQVRATAQDARVKLDLPQRLYPMLVTFTDNDDPKSVERVDPANLASSFGAGVRLKRITVAVTDDDVTKGIEKRLGWLPNVYQILSGTKFKPEGIPVGNFIGLFSTELSK